LGPIAIEFAQANPVGSKRLTLARDII